MAIVQEPENAADDPRWIQLRVSRINLLLNAVGVLVALAMLGLVPLPNWLRIALASIFLAAFLWDLRLVLLRSRRSVSAFYLFDLDSRPGPGIAPPPSAKLGIRVRYADTVALARREADGIVLSGAVVSPWFTAIRYALPQDPRWRKWWPHIIPIWRDSVAADPFRRVRVALKWK
jgi:hypothetical protein